MTNSISIKKAWYIFKIPQAMALAILSTLKGKCIYATTHCVKKLWICLKGAGCHLVIFICLEKSQWVFLQKRGMSRWGSGVSIILLPASTACLQRWMWWNCWWRLNDRHIQRSYEKVLIQHQREPIVPQPDSFLSLRVSSLCTHSCNSHINICLSMFVCVSGGQVVEEQGRNVLCHANSKKCHSDNTNR